MSKTLNRRNFLRVSAAGGALVISGYIPGLRNAGTAEAAGLFEPNIWLKIGADDMVTIMLSQLEMGQGVMTSMPMLVDKAAALPVPKTVSLKSPKEFRLLGQPVARLDIPEKVNGKAVFGIDVKRPGMLVARVVRCPVFGGKVESFNADKAKAVAGVRNVVKISSGVAVVADNYWAASKGATALEVKWNEGPLANLSSADIMKKYAALAEQPGKVARNDGDASAAVK